MTLVIDTSVFVEAERRGADLSAIVALAPPNDTLTVPAIVIAESLVGVHLGQPEARRREREDFIGRVIGGLPILSFDVGVAAVYSELWAMLRRAGGIIPPHDLMIGATALYHDARVLTNNLRDFDRIPGVRTLQPSWPA